MQKTTRFLFCSNDGEAAALLGACLGEIGLLTQEAVSPENLAQRLADISPKVLFLDFALAPNEPGKLLRSAELARLVARLVPGIARVAVGKLAQPEGAIAALRAGITEFVDPSVDPGEVSDVVRRLLDTVHRRTPAQETHSSVLLLGARPGVGTSTLAVHLAAAVQERMLQIGLAKRVEAGVKLGKGKSFTGAHLALDERVGVLDLGCPVADCMLYLNLHSHFHFAEAVANLRRLDPTLLGSALAHTESGICALSLPADLKEMRSVSQSDALMLYERLHQHFGLLLVDAGGFANPDFVLGLARSSPKTWLVTDQSVGSLVSLAELIKSLDEGRVDRSNIRLVVNKYDERYGMRATQIAERFELPLAGVLPERTYPLMAAANQGKLLHETSERDPYVRGVQALVERIASHAAHDVASGGRGGWMKAWLPGVQRRMS